MKKLSLLLALVMTASIVATGCGKSDSSSSASGDDSSAKSGHSSSVDDGVMRDGLTAMTVAKEMGLGENLGNTMEAYEATNCETIEYKWIPTVGDNTPKDYETCWGAVETTQEVIDGMKDAGFDTVRIPVFWGNMMKDDGKWEISEEYLERVAEIIDYCRKDGLYAVINIHHFDEFIIRRNNLEDSKKIITNLWTQIADYYKDYSDYLVFEGFNEYLGGSQFDENGELKDLPKAEAYEMTNTLNQAFVDAVRSTGGNNANRVLIASGYWTNIDNTTKADFVMPTDTAENKLMVSCHYVDNTMYWTNQIGGDTWLEYATNQCELLKAAFTDKGIPVFIGEVTSIYTTDHFDANSKYSTSTECLEVMMNMMLDYGFVPVLWDVNDNFYSRTTYTIKNADDAALIKKLADGLEK